MNKQQITALKTQHNMLLLGAEAALKQAADIRVTIANETGRAWHVEGAQFGKIEALATEVGAVLSYDKGASYEKRPGQKPPRVGGARRANRPAARNFH